MMLLEQDWVMILGETCNSLFPLSRDIMTAPQKCFNFIFFKNTYECKCKDTWHVPMFQSGRVTAPGYIRNQNTLKHSTCFTTTAFFYTV